jgi:hypothetical protein
VEICDRRANQVLDNANILSAKLSNNSLSLSKEATGENREIISRRLGDSSAPPRKNLQDDILRNHATDAVIYDVLPPMKYDGTEAYRRSWGDWQPTRRAKDALTCRIFRSSLALMLHLPIASFNAGEHSPTARPLKIWCAPLFA